MRLQVIKTVLKGVLLAVALSGVSWADSNTAEGEALVIRYPMLGEEYGQTWSNYFLELLTLALEKAGEEYVLDPVTLSNFRESRSVMSVAKGVYDIHWMNTNATRETVLRPVRVPLFKGLIGWRLLMVRSGDEDQFANMTDLEPLRDLKTVQGHDWPDSAILEHNGLPVIRTPHWEGMFKMLYAGRVDYFPRSVVEVWKEQRVFSELELAVDEHVVLVYPSAYYFFVRRNNERLAEAIERGLLAAIDDGSFDRVIMAHFGESLKRARLDERTLIRLDNPLMTPDTPLDRPELWYRP
ncbi:amino acid ABC transporter substrate-binding protein (PAAT family) [Marinimicrobium koreense]|uniref:Amino acid ABC transporter substrate-binding protein (PAAT family) n=1 Tax=Marinimicrobium koreense TaxID=306545 RepID=A0A3N1NZ38_9GAMM|nr:transporter substrate-binding domain-containing protein [Marinimicrobium koreense]ROQ20267.1 amino acid ABC transporter substrate-binding protein (PAAT family) [Marinimicrobium koreense]